MNLVYSLRRKKVNLLELNACQDQSRGLEMKEDVLEANSIP